MKRLLVITSGLVLTSLLSFAQNNTFGDSRVTISITTGLKIFESNSSPDQYNHVHFRTDPSIGLDILFKAPNVGMRLQRDYYFGVYARNPMFDINSYYETTLLGLYKRWTIAHRIPFQAGIDYGWQKQEFFFFWVYPPYGKVPQKNYPYRGIYSHIGSSFKWLDIELGYFLIYQPSPELGIDQVWLSLSHRFQLNFKK